jgi:hypothetical protein
MVDNTIALQVRPFQMPDVGQIYGQAQNIQMNRMRMAEAQETAQERNALRGLLSSGVDINTPEGMAQLRRAAPMLAPQFEQAASQRAYQQARTQQAITQTQTARVGMYRDELGGVNDQTAWDNWRGRVVQEFPQFAASIPSRFSPEARLRVAGGADEIVRGARAGGERAQAQSAREQRITDTMATFGVDRATALGLVDNIISVVPGSAGEEPVLINKLTGEMTRPRMGATRPAAPPPPGEERPPIDLRRPQAAAPAAAPTNMMLPGATAAAAPTSVEDFYAGRRQRQVEQAGATAEAQARVQAVERRVEQTAAVPEAGATTGAQETARLEARSAATQRAEAAQLDTAISELQRISAPGGLLERSTGSGVGRLVDIAGEFIGVSSRAAQAAAALAPIADVVLKLVPRFEGPQSDRDTQSYRDAAGRLSDPTIPNETRLAAAREILRLMRNRRDQFQFGEGGAARPAAAAPATPQAVPPVPAGVNMPQAEWSRLWGVMSPQERALWQN